MALAGVDLPLNLSSIRFGTVAASVFKGAAASCVEVTGQRKVERELFLSLEQDRQIIGASSTIATR
jgi:hypothetical protein